MRCCCYRIGSVLGWFCASGLHNNERSHQVLVSFTTWHLHACKSSNSVLGHQCHMPDDPNPSPAVSNWPAVLPIFLHLSLPLPPASRTLPPAPIPNCISPAHRPRTPPIFCHLPPAQPSPQYAAARTAAHLITTSPAVFSAFCTAFPTILANPTSPNIHSPSTRQHHPCRRWLCASP